MNGAGGRFVSTEECTDKELSFAQFYVSNGGNTTDAARLAGYANPNVDGFKAVRRPRVRAVIRGLATGKAWALRLVAMAALERVLKDVGQPGDVTVRAIREAREFASDLDAIDAKMAERDGIPDGSPSVPDRGGMGELGDFLAQVVAATGTTADQPTDNKQ